MKPKLHRPRVFFLLVAISNLDLNAYSRFLRIYKIVGAFDSNCTLYKPIIKLFFFFFYFSSGGLLFLFGSQMTSLSHLLSCLYHDSVLGEASRVGLCALH